MKLVSPIVRTIEDAATVAVGGAVTAFTASGWSWSAVGDMADWRKLAIAGGAAALPVVRSGVALLLSGKRSSGLIEALRYVRAGLEQLDLTDPPTAKHAAPAMATPPAPPSAAEALAAAEAIYPIDPPPVPAVADPATPPTTTGA